MGDFDYGREHGLWGKDGIPYDLDERDSYQSSSRRRSNANQQEIQYYVELMKDLKITTIVQMNKYISKNQLWSRFSSIRRKNTFTSGFSSIGISKIAYKQILNLYQAKDVITTHLVEQKRI